MIVSFVIEGFFFCFAKLKVSHGLLLDLSDGLFRSLPVSHTSFYLANLSEVQKAEKEGGLYHISKFVYDAENDCYQCPMGQILKYQGTRKHKDKSYKTRAYRCKNGGQCPVRRDCSKDANGRCVERSPFVGAILRQKEKQRDPSKAALLRKRMTIAEPAFARVKHLLEFRRWTMGGLEKVRAQWMFVCALVNLGRIYPLWREGKLHSA